MKLKLSAIFLIITFVVTGWAKEEAKAEQPAPKHYPVNFSIYYPLSLNKSKKDSVNLNFSLIYGHVGRVKGIDLAAVGSVIEDDLKGIQLSGLGGVVGNSMKGIQAAGLFSIAGDRSSGIQASGLFSVTGDDFKGIQGSGLFSIVGDRFTGIQDAGLFSIVGNDFKGVQLSGFFSIVGERFAGMQAAGLFSIIGESGKGFQIGTINIAGEEFKGVQAGVFNIVGERCLGVQLGVVNRSGLVKGSQVGVVNISDRIDGIPFGLVNLSKHNGRVRWITWGSSITAVNSGLKMMVKNIYSIFSVGGGNLEKDISASFTTGFHYGVHFPLKKSFFNVDAGYVNIDNEKYFKALAGDVDQHLLEVRASFGLDISPSFSIFAGGGYGYMIDHHEDFDTGESLPFFFAGIELFNFNFL
jgi:hypothetical protein